MAESPKLAGGSRPRLAYLWKAEYAREGVAEVVKETARHCGAVVGLVVESLLVHIGLCPWEDYQSSRHGGGGERLF